MEGMFRKFFRKKVPEQAPASLSSSENEDPYPSMSPEDRERFGLNETIEEVDKESMKKLFNSDELVKAFENMRAQTFPRAHATNMKREIVLQTKENNIMSREILSRGTAVYIGSGDDIEYPLLLGARDITLVDSGTESPERFIEVVLKKINDIGGKEITIKESTISFKIIESEEAVPVTVHLERKNIAGFPGNDTETEDYVAPQNISLLLSFNSGGDADKNISLINGIIPGGYIVPDRIGRSDEEMRELGFTAKYFSSDKIKKMKVFQKDI